MYGGKQRAVDLGEYKGFVLEPPKPGPEGTRPWVWYAPVLGNNPDKQLLACGHRAVSLPPIEAAPPRRKSPTVHLQPSSSPRATPRASTGALCRSPRHQRATSDALKRVPLASNRGRVSAICCLERKDYQSEQVWAALSSGAD